MQHPLGRTIHGCRDLEDILPQNNLEPHGGQLSLGSLVGFVTLFGITMRNSIIMTISPFDQLVSVEGTSSSAESKE
jgi:hypothetical protein